MKQWATDQPGRDGLRMRDVPMPVPRAGEVLIKVAAVALNYRDKVLLERGAGPATGATQFPYVPCSDVAGQVEAVGEGAGRFEVGDDVISTFYPKWRSGPVPDGSTARSLSTPALAAALPGVLAEYVCLPEDFFVSAPSQLDAAEASTLVCAGTTAWEALGGALARLGDKTVLVHGTGGVAILALQMAQALGADMIVVSRSDAKLASAKALGAAHTINRTAGDWVESVYRATRDSGVDLIVDTIGGENLGESLRALAPGGSVSAVGLLDSAEFRGLLPHLATKSIRGITVGPQSSTEELVAMVDQHNLKPVIDGRYAFTEVHAAFDHLERGPFGKVVITVS